MTSDKSEQTLREIVVENPTTIRVFESLGIDYCCGGKQSLRDACARTNIPLETMVGLLANAGPRAGDATAWNDAAPGVLIDHIVETHHGFVRREGARIESLLAKVLARHGQPAVGRIAEIFAKLMEELSAHMLKEEQVLFPYIKALEQAALEQRACPPSPFGTVQRPIAMMIAEHEDAGALLAELRSLTDGYRPPKTACPTFIGLYRALEDFERDLHLHVHLENNILFPRAVELERSRLPLAVR